MVPVVPLAVPVARSEHRLEQWRDVANDVYGEYLSKPYTLKSYKEDWAYPSEANPIIPRPNHGLLHTLRTAAYVGLVVKAYNFFHPDHPIPELEIDKMQLALLFFVVGRENDAGRLDLHDDYVRFRQKSADAFERYVISKPALKDRLGFTDVTELQFYKQGVLDPYKPEVYHEPRYHVIRFCHDLDLRRCYTEDRCSQKQEEAASQFGYIVGLIADLATECIRETGDRICQGPTYNGPTFISCSQDVGQAIDKIAAVFKRKQDNILCILNFTSPPPQIHIPTELNKEVCDPMSPWRLSDELFKQLKLLNSPSYKKVLVTPQDKEWNFIWKYFHYQKPTRYGIKRVWVVHNRTILNAFESHFPIGEQRAKQFNSKMTGPYASERNRVLDQWRQGAAIFSPVITKEDDGRINRWDNVKVIPLWHGTRQEIAEKICEGGLTYFGKTTIPGTGGPVKSTDDGYFGSGIYFTNSARYSADCFSGGHLFLTWVAMREPFPVIGNPQQSDMKALRGKGAHSSYDAHYIPVISTKQRDHLHNDYHPAKWGQTATCDEYVVFQSSQTLPQFWVELEPDMIYLMAPKQVSNNLEGLKHQLMKILQNREVRKHADLWKVLSLQLGKIYRLQDNQLLTAEHIRLSQLINQLITVGDDIDQNVKVQIIKEFQCAPVQTSAYIELKKTAIAQLKKNCYLLSTMNDDLRNDEEVVKVAVDGDWKNIEHASQRIRSKFDFMICIIKKNGMALQYADEDLKKNSVFVFEAIKQNLHAAQFAAHSLLADANFVKNAMVLIHGFFTDGGLILQYVDTSLRENIDFMYDLLLANCSKKDTLLKYSCGRVKNQMYLIIIGEGLCGPLRKKWTIEEVKNESAMREYEMYNDDDDDD